jgi:RNA recognition motif-containing protein
MKSLFVGNLPHPVSEGDLKEWFAQAGFPALDIEIAKDALTGKPKGFAVVALTGGNADQAIRSCNGREFRGRMLVVNEARTMVNSLSALANILDAFSRLANQPNKEHPRRK